MQSLFATTVLPSYVWERGLFQRFPCSYLFLVYFKRFFSEKWSHKRNPKDFFDSKFDITWRWQKRNEVQCFEVLFGPEQKRGRQTERIYIPREGVGCVLFSSTWEMSQLLSTMVERMCLPQAFKSNRSGSGCETSEVDFLLLFRTILTSFL